jgi:hypothetical protein
MMNAMEEEQTVFYTYPTIVANLYLQGKINDKDADLLTAVYYQDDDAIKIAVARGANPNQILYNPLLYAVKRGNIDLIKFLIDQGADPSFEYPDPEVSAVAFIEKKGLPTAAQKVEEAIRSLLGMEPLPVARAA